MIHTGIRTVGVKVRIRITDYHAHVCVADIIVHKSSVRGRVDSKHIAVTAAPD
jgi:hypothetical protein